jgi:hypothetical protein
VKELLKYLLSCSSQILNNNILYSVLKRIEKSMEERAKQSLRRRIVHQTCDAEELTLFRNELLFAYNRFMVIYFSFNAETRHTDSLLHHDQAGVPTAYTKRHLTARCSRISCNRHHRTWRREAGHFAHRCPKL